MTLKAKRILITRTDRLGDVVLSTAVVRHLKKLYPSSYIAFMVRPENKDVVLNNPDLDEVIVYDKKGKEKSFLNTIKFALSLKKKNFDIGIALHPTNRVHIIMFLAGIPLRIGYDRKMSMLLNKRVPHVKHYGDKHEASYNFELLEGAGFDVKEADIKPYIVTSKEEKLLVDRVYSDLKLGDNVIAIHPGASCASKRWDARGFAEVADELKKKYSSNIALIGADETASFSNAVKDAMRSPAIDLTGNFLVGELAEFLSRCRLFVSNDSGPVHVAVAVGTPTVVIFGRKDPGLSPKRWGPLGEKSRILHGDAGCKKCLAHDCLRDYACLKAVTAQEVIKAADELLAS